MIRQLMVVAAISVAAVGPASAADVSADAMVARSQCLFANVVTDGGDHASVFGCVDTGAGAASSGWAEPRSGGFACIFLASHARCGDAPAGSITVEPGLTRGTMALTLDNLTANLTLEATSALPPLGHQVGESGTLAPESLGWCVFTAVMAVSEATATGSVTSTQGDGGTVTQTKQGTAVADGLSTAVTFGAWPNGAPGGGLPTTGC